MPYTTSVSGTAITASWANASVRDQTTTPFADSTARGLAITSPIEGMLTVLTGTNSLDIYTGAAWSTAIFPYGAWTTWTPTVSGTGWALGNGVVAGAYMKAGVGVMVFGKVTFGSTSTFGAANPLQVGGFPFDFNNTDAAHGLVVTVNDSSLSTFSDAHCQRASASTVTITAANAGSQWVNTSSTVPITWAQSDEVIIAGTYQGS